MDFSVEEGSLAFKHSHLAYLTSAEVTPGGKEHGGPQGEKSCAGPAVESSAVGDGEPGPQSWAAADWDGRADAPLGVDPESTRRQTHWDRQQWPGSTG